MPYKLHPPAKDICTIGHGLEPLGIDDQYLEPGTGQY